MVQKLVLFGLSASMFLSIDPLNVNAYAYRGLVKNCLKKHDEAAADCSKAVELDPQKAGGYVSLGFVQNDQMHFQPALDNFRKSVQLDSLLDYPASASG